MKKIYLFALLVLPLSGLAQNPTFKSFDTNQFQITGIGVNSIRVKPTNWTQADAALSNSIAAQAALIASNTAAIAAQDTTNAALLAQITNLHNAVFISPSGDDANNGSFTNPLATLGKALTNLNGNGHIIFRGGNYTNHGGNLTRAKDIKLSAYATETPRFFHGLTIPANAWALLSNNVYFTTNFAAEAYHAATNALAGNPPGQAYIFEAGAGYGTNDFPFPLLDFTNSLLRMRNFPLVWTNSVTEVANATAAKWHVTNDTLYVKFSDAGAPVRDIQIKSTNAVGFYSTSTNDQTIEIDGLHIYYPQFGVHVENAKSVTIRNTYVEGAFIGTYLNNVMSTVLKHNEIAGCQFGIEMRRNYLTIPGQVEEDDCYYHDNYQESTVMRGNLRRTANRLLVIGGYFGPIDDGSVSRYTGCTMLNQVRNNAQLGQNLANVHPSEQYWTDSWFGRAGIGCISIAEEGNFLRVENSIFDPIEVAFHVVDSTGTSRIEIGPGNMVTTNNFGPAGKLLVINSYTNTVIHNKQFYPMVLTNNTIGTGYWLWPQGLFGEGQFALGSEVPLLAAGTNIVIEATATNATTGQVTRTINSTSSGGSFTSPSNMLYVAKNGDDGNDGTLAEPFLTVQAAINAWTAETIEVFPGLYDECITNLQDGMKFYFHPGATNTYTGAPVTTWTNSLTELVWTVNWDIPTNINISIAGYGDFHSQVESNGIVFNVSGGRLEIESNNVLSTNDGGIAVQHLAGEVVGGARVLTYGKKYGYSWMGGGEVWKCPFVNGDEAGFWFDYRDDDAYATSYGSFFLDAQKTGSIYTYGFDNMGANGSRLWFSATEVLGYIGVSQVRAYFTEPVAKVHGPSEDADVGTVAVSNGQVWGNFQKIVASGGGAISMIGGSAGFIQYQNIEDNVGGEFSLLTVQNTGSNEVQIAGLSAVGAANRDVVISSSAATNAIIQINNISSASNPFGQTVFMSANGAALKDCHIVTANTPAGAVITAEIDSAGSGYEVDDEVTLDDGDDGCVMIVTEVGGSGEVTQIGFREDGSDRGTGYGTGVKATVGGMGSALQINVTSVSVESNPISADDPVTVRLLGRVTSNTTNVDADVTIELPALDLTAP